MAAAYIRRRERASSFLGLLPALVMVFLVCMGLPPKAEANGGVLVFEGRVAEYMVSVTVNPPTPRPGLVLVGVIVKAVVSTNGDGHTSLVNVATELSVTATGPEPVSHVIGPLQPQTILPGISHFDLAMEVPQPGEWLLSLELGGPLGDVTVAVPFTVTGSDAIVDREQSTDRSPLAGWLLVTPLLVMALVVVPLWVLRRRHGSE